jgi:hypothetical protein
LLTEKNSDSQSVNSFHIFIRNIKKEAVEDVVTPILKDSVSTERGWKKPIRLLFIDGNHKYPYVKLDFLIWERHVPVGGLIIMHDTRDLSDKRIKNNKRIPLTHL